MRRTRDIALRAGLYLTVALSGFATAYVLKEWLPHWWDAARVLPESDSSDDKTSRSSPQQDRSPTTPCDEHLAHEHTLPAPSLNGDAPTPSTRTLPPLRTHSLPPPLPNGHALLSSINADTISPTTSAGSFHSGEDGIEQEGASQTNTSDTDTESFVHVLSPAPTHVISRRRSMRAHDLFAASHISFSELGSMVAPPK